MIKIALVYIATTERIKKSLQKTFKEFGFEMVAESN